MTGLTKTILIPLCLFTLVAAAQKPTAVPVVPSNFFEYTPDSYSGRANLPYDSTFTLKIHVPNKDSLLYALLLRGKRNTSLLDLIGRKKYSYFNYVWDTSSSPTLILRFDKYYNEIMTKQYNTDSTSKKDQDQPAGVLKPGNRYSIVLVHPVLEEIFHTSNYSRDDNSIFNEFYNLKIAESNNDPNTNAIKVNAFQHYKRVVNSVAQNTRLPSIPPNTIKAYKYFQDEIYPVYQKWYHIIDSINNRVTQNDKISFELATLQSCCIPTLLKNNSLEPCFKNDSASKECQKCQDTSCNAIQALEALYSLKSEDWSSINIGELSLQNYERGRSTEVKVRIENDKLANLKLSVHALQSVLDALRSMEWRIVADTCNKIRISHEDSSALDCIKTVRLTIFNEIGSIRSVSNDLNAIVSAQAEFQREVKKNTSEHFSGVDVLNTDTYIMDFQTRTSVYITPVFGYAVYGFQHQFTDFSPYLGFQVNFQPMNRNVPFNLIQSKTLLQRFCFTTAWTLRSVSAAGKRSDFFGNSSSLITAIGFKLSHVFMLNVGTLWFKRVDPNPLVAEKRIVATPLSSLSINFNVAQLLNIGNNGFTSLIPSL